MVSCSPLYNRFCSEAGCCMAAETVLSPAQWDLMNTIRCSGETLLTLITDILDFSRIEADKMVLVPGEFHLQSVIEAAMEIAGLHAAQKRLQVSDASTIATHNSYTVVGPFWCFKRLPSCPITQSVTTAALALDTDSGAGDCRL